MEEILKNGQSPSIWGSMQDLTLWSCNDHENGEESAQNYRGGVGSLVNDLKAGVYMVTKKTIGNTIQHERLKSCSARKVSLLKKAHVQACL